jgi:hypothetical protein
LLVALDPQAGRDLAGPSLAARDGQYALDGGPVRRVLAGQPPSHGPAGQRGRCRRERRGVGRVEVGRERVHEVGLVAEDLGLAGEDRDDVALRDGVEQREELVTHPVAAERR